MVAVRGRLRLFATAGLMLVTFAIGWALAKSGLVAVTAPPPLSQLEQQFAERMTDVVLVGQFTVAGREDRGSRQERYEIASVTKVDDNRWRFMARIMYGQVDVELPVTVTMAWAGDTPMITMTDVSIPMLGTFTARVLFYGDRYAGTWQHDEVGGHMFGRIEQLETSRE